MSCTSLSKSENNLPDNSEYSPRELDLRKADEIARESAKWFNYTTGVMANEHSGQCGDYAGKNIARLVTANNPVPSGTYRLGEKTDVSKLGFHGFNSGSSGFLSWKGQLYIYHPVLGAYPIFIEKEWTPKLHFGIDMLDKEQVHVWASTGEVSVDPTYFDLWPDPFAPPFAATLQ